MTGSPSSDRFAGDTSDVGRDERICDDGVEQLTGCHTVAQRGARKTGLERELQRCRANGGPEVVAPREVALLEVMRTIVGRVLRGYRGNRRFAPARRVVGQLSGDVRLAHRLCPGPASSKVRVAAAHQVSFEHLVPLHVRQRHQGPPSRRARVDRARSPCAVIPRRPRAC
jgi:hypothetical protein